MPAFNEAATIVGVLDDLISRVDFVIVVDDGSTDGTGAIVDAWALEHATCRSIHLVPNQGLSAALRAGWEEIRAMVARGEATEDDVAFSIDADGQHEPAAIDGMVEHLVRGGHACVIGKRDLGYHTSYKRFGNHVMTWIARWSGGAPFEDIESGYRVFRIGPLLAAQEYYRGYRYSETVEVAVLLTRMGHSVDNTYPVAIPVARTRTRLKDAAVDAACMPLAWYRLACWQGTTAAQRVPWVATAAIVVAAAWAVTLLAMLQKTFYLGDDSAHSYAHVWYLARSIYTDHAWPLHVASLENGDAVMFPYGFIPWFPAALVRPIFGDWAVTVSMVGGLGFLVAALWRLRPSMKNPLLFGLFLLNPFLWNGVTQFQLGTVWAFAFALAAAAAYERDRMTWATALAAAAIASHPMMGSLALALYGVIEWLKVGSFPWRLAIVGAVAATIASPFILLFFSTPLLREGGRVLVLFSAFDNFRRLSIVALVLLLPMAKRWVFNHQQVLYTAGAAASVAVLIVLPPSGLWTGSHPQFAEYLAANPINHSSSYRVLVENAREDGMVEFMKAGAVLSQEFFTESIRRQNFSMESYQCFLATRKTGHVVISGGYIRRHAYNEPQLLAQLAQQGLAEEEYRDARGTIAYTVTIPPEMARGSLHDCGL